LSLQGPEPERIFQVISIGHITAAKDKTGRLLWLPFYNSLGLTDRDQVSAAASDFLKRPI